MEHIKIKHTYEAVKMMTQEENIISSPEDFTSIPIKATSMPMNTVLFCEHCKTMDDRYKFYSLDRKGEDIPGGKEQISGSMLDLKAFANCGNYFYGSPIKTVQNAVDYVAFHYRAESTLKNYCKKRLEKNENTKLPRYVRDNDELVPEKYLQYMLSIRFKRDKNKKPQLFCPNCGKRIDPNNIKFLTKNKSWIMDNAMLHSFEIKESDEDKFIISAYFYSAFPVVNVGKIKYLETNVRFIFNKKNRNIYAMQPILATGMKPVYKDYGKKIIKITHYGNAKNFLTGLQKKLLKNQTILDSLADYICKLEGVEKEEVFAKSPSFCDIAYFFRYPKYNKEVRDTIAELYKYDIFKNASKQRRKLLLLSIYAMQENPAIMLEEMKKKKLPAKKRVRKMVAKNPFVIIIYRYLTKLGMKDYNVILDSIESMGAARPLLVLIAKRLLLRQKDCDIIKDFLIAFIKEKGDIAAKKCIFDVIGLCNKNAETLLTDTAHLYHTIMRELEGEPFIGRFEDLRKMHNEFSSLLTKLKHRNKKIPYIIEDMKFNRDYGDCSFRLAPDTVSLIDCGEKMGICVGGYGDRALSRSLKIVFLMQNKKYKGCIELSANGKTICQAKAKFNNKIQGTAAYALKQWIEDLELEPRSHDCAHIMNNNIEMEDDETKSFNYSITTKYEDPDDINFGTKISSTYYILDKEEISEPDETIPQEELQIDDFADDEVIPFMVDAEDGDIW